jgi:hypothetical protein
METLTIEGLKSMLNKLDEFRTVDWETWEA